MRTHIVILALTIALASAQFPKRLQIPGAIPLGGGPLERPLPLRRQQPLNPPARLRRPIPNAIPLPQPSIRPVVEDSEEQSLNLSEEVARLAQLPVPSSTPRQHLIEQDEEEEPAPRPYIPPQPQFRPERPPIQVATPVRAAPPPVRQAQPARAAPVRQVARPSRPQPQYIDDEDVPRRQRNKKPEVLILRKYREDNPDGSITWGFENDDGTFKEETIGVDCITRGKYGYVDPDGNRREYTYETGLYCDKNQPELPEEPLIQPVPHGKQFKNRPSQPVRV
ncbi:uncharacterized protein CBL_07600 [Carabus blaptoides fortunei]